MTYSLTWLADVLRGAGLRVREIPGWQGRGHGNLAAVRGVMLHHTAGPASGDYPSENTVVNGRPGLPGPLANLGLSRDGTWIVIAAGIAYHAGQGSYPGIPTNSGNARTIGVEAESTGRGDWTPEQLEAYPRGVAEILRHVGLGADRAIGHKEYAPGRKVDPAGWPGDMDGFRARVRQILDGEIVTPHDLRQIEDAAYSAVLNAINDAYNRRGDRQTEARTNLVLMSEEGARRAVAEGVSVDVEAVAHAVADRVAQIIAPDVAGAVMELVAPAVTHAVTTALAGVPAAIVDEAARRMSGGSE